MFIIQVIMKIVIKNSGQTNCYKDSNFYAGSCCITGHILVTILSLQAFRSCPPAIVNWLVAICDSGWTTL